MEVPMPWFGLLLAYLFSIDILHLKSFFQLAPNYYIEIMKSYLLFTLRLSSIDIFCLGRYWGSRLKVTVVCEVFDKLGAAVIQFFALLMWGKQALRIGSRNSWGFFLLPPPNKDLDVLMFCFCSMDFFTIFSRNCPSSSVFSWGKVPRRVLKKGLSFCSSYANLANDEKNQ